eukprot:CAMPEP_0177665450 /NCGR_PEP_ID=MMETSP0447-20121125/21059_1 /TAXON_ID=0 /ORGANISM="Stygamoeba regulata, Strain BSH-02190019" /LENGTH=599 /DNA_ID=CAMNT_0019171541 /DNA_START=639 /DNA_END=2440 /DNA_ORIENTATION=+
MPDEKPVIWSDACFVNAAVKADMIDGAVNLTLSLEDRQGVVCEDYLLFATATTWHAQVFRKPGTHVIQWHGMSADELNDVEHNGFRVFRFNGTLPEMVSSVYETLLLFVGADTGNASVPETVANANRDFLRDNANYDMVERTSGFQLAEELPESTFQSGDFLAIIRLDGIDPMLAWAMGAHTGHTAMTVWEQGQLYVMESTNRTNYWPTSGVQKTPWKTWIRQAQEADFNVVHIPLTGQARQQFDVDAALSFFNNYAEGLDYGFNNMLYCWIDTPEDNFPGSLTAEMGMVLFGVLDAIIPPADKIWLAGMNMRLNTTDLNTIQCYAEAERRGINFTSLITIPEQDSWRYSNGLNMVCDVFVCMMLKEGGMFGDLKDEIQCTEFTNWDVYSLDFYDPSPSIPQACKDADPGMPHCQIMGKYRMTLPGVGTISYFSHMREHCPSLAPDYAMRNELVSSARATSENESSIRATPSSPELHIAVTTLRTICEISPLGYKVTVLCVQMKDTRQMPKRTHLSECKIRGLLGRQLQLQRYLALSTKDGSTEYVTENLSKTVILRRTTSDENLLEAGDTKTFKMEAHRKKASFDEGTYILGLAESVD